MVVADYLDAVSGGIWVGDDQSSYTNQPIPTYNIKELIVELSASFFWPDRDAASNADLEYVNAPFDKLNSMRVNLSIYQLVPSIRIDLVGDLRGFITKMQDSDELPQVVQTLSHQELVQKVFQVAKPQTTPETD